MSTDTNRDALTNASAISTKPQSQPSTNDTYAHKVLALVAQHRLATSPQLHQLISPEGRRQTISAVLNRLREDKLLSYTVLPASNRTRAWYLTPQGARVVASWPELRGRPVQAPSGGTDAGLRAAHTLTVLRAHLAFLHDARARGDEYGPLDWVPEVAHRLPDTGGEDRLIADAVLHYTAITPRRLQFRAFVEVDRATMSSERLSRKLISYARFHEYLPQLPGRRGTVADQDAMLAWQRFYPRFPRVLFVLTGAGPDALQQRINDLRAMVAGHPLVTQLAGKVQLGAAVLEDLEQYGATGPVWSPLSSTNDERRSWMEL
ncbi:replication-relaxation family protein [Actinacidiphila glaucinigra]|uniref:Replication-relaxation n=1 Tax=Actinacidiphila glaucinigra TaxID=235986 RepID=A0A239LR14_9ACTN|nr:replication-relaxation family protein [Actinacidiphila glaucinigra]SNT33137.1 Replication-relaxation [Actinacidiphila glaucinigra]